MQNQFENQDEGAVALLEAPDAEVQISIIEAAPDPLDQAIASVIDQISKAKEPQDLVGCESSIRMMECPAGYVELAAGSIKVVGVNRTALKEGTAPWVVDFMRFDEERGYFVRDALVAQECLMPDGAWTILYPAGCLDAGPAVRMATNGRMFLKVR